MAKQKKKSTDICQKCQIQFPIINSCWFPETGKICPACAKEFVNGFERDKKIRDQAQHLFDACIRAKTFYEAMFSASGGCDHSVGICECADHADYDKLCAIIATITNKEK